MASDHKDILYIERSKNELDLARAIFKLSTDTHLKIELELKEDSTFFSNVIATSYYCIFYAAKALLISKGITTDAPEEHRKTLEEFENLVHAGIIDVELLQIYKSIVIKADELLGIFKKEKSKRGRFTYQRLPQANLGIAEESLVHAEKFFKNGNLIVRNNR